MATILIIEDNDVIRENTAELLEIEGYKVITAIDGKDGFDRIVDCSPDLIVCDILMPEMDGFELMGKLGKHPDLKKIPLIVFSSKSEKSDIKRGLDLGANDYIVKPSDLEDLLLSIKRSLENRKKS